MTNLVDFYPTPVNLIAKLVEGISFNHSTSVLEPSAGKGNICDYIKEQYYRYNDIDIDTIEIDTDLQHILRGKEYKVVHDNFLTFESRKHYNFIIANFPFSEGDKHLAKALSILEKTGGELRCLVNAETIKNPFSNLRNALLTKLEDLGAEIEYLTDEFITAERPTAVEVALIKVKIEVPQPFSFILSDLRKSQTINDLETAQQELVETDFLKSIVARFNVECDLGIKLINEYKAMQPYIQDRLQKEDSARPLLQLKVEGTSNNVVNNFLRGVRKKYWEALINDPRFNNQYTSNILTELSRKLEELKDYDFSVFNIRELQKDLSSKVVNGIEAAILKLFDTFSREHAYGDTFGTNIHYYNGWKTNKAHKVNHKIIIPMYGLSTNWSGGTKLEYNMQEKLQDMVKVFNYLSEDKLDVPQLVGSCIYNANNNQNFNLDLRYLQLKLYKKGTCHIKFTNQALLDKFNIFGGQRKNWLPPSYGKATYNDMSKEEQQVIDEFQGKEEYAKVMENASFYLTDISTLLLNAGDESAV